MKKKTIFNCFLALIPVAAFFMATTGDSVAVYDIAAQEVYKLSYFAPVVGASYAFLTPLAGWLTVVTAVLALVMILGKKAGCLPWLKWLSLVAACVAVAPMLLQGNMRVVPNFFLPLLMMVEYLLCMFAGKADRVAPEKTEGRRLN